MRRGPASFGRVLPSRARSSWSRSRRPTINRRPLTSIRGRPAMATFVAHQAATFDSSGVVGVFTLANPLNYLSAFSNKTSTGFTFAGDNRVVVNAVGTGITYGAVGVPGSGTITELHVANSAGAYFDLTNAFVSFTFMLPENFSTQAAALFQALTGG